MAGSVSASPHRIVARPTPVATPVFDQAIADIADYICDYECSSALLHETARLCLFNALGSGMEALEYPGCTKLLDPVVPGAIVPSGAKIPLTAYVLDARSRTFAVR
jgi:2-methylcitrate dehydratase